MKLNTSRWSRAAAWTAVALVLLFVLTLYMQPEFLRTLADQLWACF